MLIALILFISGALIGRYHDLSGLVATSCALVVLRIVLWALAGEVTVVGAIVLVSHLFAIQSGFLIASYFRFREG